MKIYSSGIRISGVGFQVSGLRGGGGQHGDAALSDAVA